MTPSQIHIGTIGAKKYLLQHMQDDVLEVFNAGCTIGAYLIFPNKRVNKKHTINQARGINSYIDNRFDLTLECIRLFYKDQHSPLYEAINRYRGFFKLFENFQSYVDYFLLKDLIDKNGNIIFYLPFDHFHSKPSFEAPESYRMYKKAVLHFIAARNQRIRKQTSKVFDGL